VGGIYFGRLLSVVYSGEALWIAVQMEQQKRNRLAVIRQQGAERQTLIVDSPGFCHQPRLVSWAKDGVAAVWSESDGDGWKVKSLLLSACRQDTPSETVSPLARLCLPPAAAVSANDELWAAWPQIEGAHIRVHLARRSSHGWQALGPVSPEGVDAFRPSIAANRQGIFLAWDQYCSGTYQVAIARIEAGGCRVLHTLCRDGEWWLGPKLLAHDKGDIYLTWVVQREVSNDLGIIDHDPFAMVARLQGKGVEYLLDTANPGDPRRVADFREGLLASRTYYSADLCYFGLRRNPYLTLGEGGKVWLLWDSRPEHRSSFHHGRLVGRWLRSDGTWAGPVVLHNNRYGYAVAERMVRKHIPTAFFNIAREGLEAIEGKLVTCEHGVPLYPDGGRWQGWSVTRIEIEPKPAEKVRVGEREYTLYWADTHVHSVFSPDVEGEVDELIHFARDVANIDAVCIVDNDCYPHKALTEAEWRVHQALCAHFTKEGQFVVFPGWEYTYHREDLEPDFNHRVIMYPRPGGRLYRRIDPEGERDDVLFRHLRGSGAMCYPHHCTYRIVDPTLDWNVEVCSSWRICLAESDFTVRMLQSGERFGFVGSSDTHRAVPGLGGALTGLYAEALTPEALFEAYRNRRTIATQGFFVLVDFRVGGIFIGGEGEVASSPEIRATVRAPIDLRSVEVLRDGATICQEEPQGREVGLRFVDTSATPGEHFYFLRVRLVGDPSLNCDPAENALVPFTHEGRYPCNLARAKGVYAWTSPIWLRVGL
jgi:hypothetical protein